MKIRISLFLFLIIGFAAQAQKKLYQGQHFTLYDNKVVQGSNTSDVLSATAMRSDYQSPENERYPNRLEFKFSINEKDNDLASGTNHFLVLNGQKVSPVYVFGTPDATTAETSTGILPVDYTFTFRLDMSTVLKQFADKGYYEAADGSKIAKDDFKGVYIAGASLPLSWDFVNLDEKGLKLTDDNHDGIYEITLVLNPSIEKKTKEWKLSQDISSKAQYKSDQPIVDALYNLSLEEGRLAIEPDNTFRTGAKWAGVWTRDISYSIILAFAYLEPEVAKTSLMRKVRRDRIIQDTGSGGSWPVSSDRTVWAIAAWEIYKVTGDRKWLEQVFPIIKNTADDDYKTLRDSRTGLYSGESSFLDWREQTYPKWMSNKDIYVSENLGTNAVHYQMNVVLSQMAKILGEPYQRYDTVAAAIKKGINDQLWNQEKGYYAQYLYGRNYLTQSPRFEALGEALTVLFGIADEKRAKDLISRSPLTEYGATCIYPQIPGIPPYHNNSVWPFVQSYWNLAAAKAGNDKALEHGLASIYRAAGLFLTNYENMVADTGDYKGTEINSDRMLWSMAGNLSMVYRVFLGIQFEENGLSLKPFIPESYGGHKTLTGFHYRNAVLDIDVNGFGSQVASVTIDGKQSKTAFIPAQLKGKHSIVITMANRAFEGNTINLTSNAFTPATPFITLKGKEIELKPDPAISKYEVYKNGKISAELNANPKARQVYLISDKQYAEYAVVAVGADGQKSFMSEPVAYSAKEPMILQAEDAAPKAKANFTNYEGSGFIALTLQENKEVIFTVNAPADGTYFIDFRYSNGSGPWNTDNKCAIRSLYVADQYEGVIVMPQRGTAEWSDWGWTNARKVTLKKGGNEVKLSFRDWNTNMNDEVNTAMLDEMRVWKE